METHKHKEKVYLLLFITLACCVALLFIKPIAQDTNYHNFADNRAYFFIPYFWNVISNLPYLLFGSAGIYFLWKERRNPLYKKSLASYFVFFAGTLGIAFGSAYYHAYPDNETLVWDRVPMTVAFMGFFSAMIGDFISERYGKILLWPLVFFGVFSVLYWRYTEHLGRGDLRLYGLVQFLPMLLVPLIVILFKTKNTRTKYLWLLMLAYLLAKFFEAGDELIFKTVPLLSGHTLKHFFASLAPLFFLLALRERKQ